MPQRTAIGSAPAGGKLECTGKVRTRSRASAKLSANDPAIEVTPADSPETGGFAPLTDLELIEGISRASEEHFNELYNRYFQRIYNFVYGRIHNHADTEEIVQETFTIVFSSIYKYSGRSSLLSWVYGIAKNTTNNNLRRVKNNNLRMQEIGRDHLRPTKSFGNCTPEEQLAIQRYLKLVIDQLEDLGEWQVEIFEMRHLQNLSIQEISQRTQRSSDSVRSSLYRVKRLLMDAAQLDSPAAV
ncbi:MAG: RNA polymerase sigma factor [Deltaproteobacteria bacterium]|nr:RNA polymerase sigma factor [Deltaproteobacteria bacterium]